MDELLTQFLIESRELADKLVDDLLALEKRPDDPQCFDEAFRGFHTLKGGAGIVEFDAMQRVLHCAEDALAAARTAARPVAARDIENCLRCLDRVVQWLDDIEQGGAVPADADPSDIVALFEQASAPLSAGVAPSPASSAWVDSLLSAHAAAAGAQAAVRYTPAADSFFRHQDPLAVVAALPGLLAMDIGAREPWPTLDELDPFSCNLVITAAVSVSAAELTTAFGAELAHCEIASLSRATPDSERESVASKANELLESQVRLLESGTEPQQPGRMASAGLVAANVLRHLGKSSEAESVETAAAVAIAEGRAQPLLLAIGAALARAPAEAREAPAAERRGPSQTIRVSAERIDALVRLTGELIIAKNSIGHALKLAEQGGSGALNMKSQHAALDRLVNEIQRAVIVMRVLPLRVVFQRFPRLIREMSAELRKPAVLVVEGEDTEADKAIVESLAEPLVHLVRNALDHGVEEPGVRTAAGKPAVATVRLRASRAGEHVVIEVADDGAGIDAAKVKQTAVQRNLVTAEAAAAMSDEEALDLIFLPGFSTAKAVTEISGRGVGMDAVRTAVSRLGGHVEARAERGKGTTVRLTLPFSVLITQVMTVEAGGQSFGIPLDAVVETMRADAVGIFPIGAAHAIVLRNRTVPLVRLADLLAKGAKPSRANGPIVVAQLGAEIGAVQVDKIGERMDIILTPLQGLLAEVPGLAGSALMGDGTVLLVLDLAEFVR